MPKKLTIVVKESIKELKGLQKQQPYNYNRLQMLILIKENVIVSKDGLATALSVSNKSVHVWRTRYNEGGLETPERDRANNIMAPSLGPND